MRHVLVCLIICAMTATASAQDKGTPLTQAQSQLLQALLADQSYHSMAISPDGKRVAAIALKRYVSQQLWAEDRGEYNTGILLIELDTMKPLLIVPTRATGGGTALRSPVSVQWIASDLMAVNFNDATSESINLAGERVAVLGTRFIQRIREKGRATDWVLAYEDGFFKKIRRVNARTGLATAYDIGLPGDLASWAFDDNGALRVVTMVDSAIFRDSTRLTHWYRADERAAWKELATFAVTDDYWLPLHVLPGADSVMVQSRQGRDTWALFAYDAKKREQAELLAGHPLEDLYLSDEIVQSNFESVTTLGMKPVRRWFDARWASVQAAVDAALPGQTNWLSGDAGGRVLVYSHSDVDPGRWLVLDTAAKTLQTIGIKLPSIDPKAMRPTQALDYAARDGMTIHAYLTLPARGAGKLPLVVLIHGGPNVRDTGGFDEEVQVLAANGYAVFQPQFRGSSGFGRRYEEAGYRQWGLAMQDDITDGVKHLIERGIVDPARACIDGASYGGYAVFWGLIKTPELYRCGISLAGVSDLEALLSGWYGADSSAFVREVRRSRIGDAAMTPRQIDAVSPVKHVDQIKLPLLIAHGEWDQRVPFRQSERLVRTLRDQGNVVVWMPFPQEGHGLANRENRLKYYTAVLGFLDKYIGPGRTVSPSTSPELAPAAASSAAAR